MKQSFIIFKLHDRKFGFTCLVLQPLTKLYTSVKVPLPAKDAPSSNGICFAVICTELNLITSIIQKIFRNE